MREHSRTRRPLGRLLFLAATLFLFCGSHSQPTPSPTPTPQHHDRLQKGAVIGLRSPLEPPIFGVHLSQLPKQQANDLYKKSLDEMNIKKVANVLADNYLKLQGQNFQKTLGTKNQSQILGKTTKILSSVHPGQRRHPQQPRQQKQRPVVTMIAPSEFVQFRAHATVNDQKKRSSLVKKPLVKTPQLLQTQARVVNDFHVKNKLPPFSLFNKTAAFLCNCNPVDFAPLHSEEGRERSFSSSGSEETSHYKVKRDDHAKVSKEEEEAKRRSSPYGASQEIGRGGKRRPKDLVRKYRYSTLELDETDDRPDVFFGDGFGSFDDFAKSFHGGSAFGGEKKVEGKFTPYSGETTDHGFSGFNSESHYSGHGGKHRTVGGPSHGASYEDRHTSSEHGTSHYQGVDHLSGHKSIYTDHKPQSHYEEDSHHVHGEREASHSDSKDIDFSNPRPSDVLRNPSHDYVDDHFKFFEYDDEPSHLRSLGKESGSPYKEHGKFGQSHESHESGGRDQYRYRLYRGDHDKIKGGKHYSEIQHFAGPESYESHGHGKEHHSAHSDEDSHYHRNEGHHGSSHHGSSDHGSSHHGSSHHGSSHHGSSHHGSSPHDETPVYTYTPKDDSKPIHASHEKTNYDGPRSLDTITHYKPLIHHHPPIDHSRPQHGSGPSFGSGSHHSGGSRHESDEYDGEHHSIPHPHSSPAVESLKQVFNSEYYEKLAENLVSKMNDDQLVSMGGKTGKREAGSQSPPSSGYQYSNGPRTPYSPHGGNRDHFKRSDKSDEEKASAKAKYNQQESQEVTNSNPSPTSYSSFQNAGKPLNSGGDIFHKEEQIRNVPEFRQNSDYKKSKPREPKFSSDDKPQRPGKSHFSSQTGHSHAGKIHKSNSVGPREPRHRQNFPFSPNSIGGPRHLGPRGSNHNRPRSPPPNFNSQHFRNSPAHPPHLPPRPPVSYNPLMTLYNSIPSVNWSNRPVHRVPGPPPPPPGL